MIEKVVLDYLTAALPGVTVALEVPATFPDKLVLIQRTGGGEDNHIRSAMFAIQSYGGSLYESALLNERVKTAMSCLASLDEIASCDLNSDYNYTDTTRKRERYQAVFDIIHY